MRNKCVNVAEKLDFQGIEGIGYMKENLVKYRKISQYSGTKW